MATSITFDSVALAKKMRAADFTEAYAAVIAALVKLL